MRDLGELRVSDEVALKLKRISSATIDRKLKHQREVLHLLRSKGAPKPGSLLKRKIPIRLTEWDTSKMGYVEMDLMIHCGSSSFGEYINPSEKDHRGVLRLVGGGGNHGQVSTIYLSGFKEDKGKDSH